ncbi:MAG: phage/plasmid primase, P4 family, partial [Anaerolineae bacterium]
GTIDLRSGELRPHNPDDLITKIAPVDYIPDAQAPTWEAFLHRIMDGNERLIAFLQRAVGYSLTGDTSERVLFILYGTGANGKTTFLETLRALLGDYGIQAPADTLLVGRENAVPNDIARLRGARFIAVSEISEGRRLAEVLVKSLTGRDTITARFLYSEFFEFRPEGKIWLATNHKPIIRGTDKAIWDRIRLIPFTVTIPEAEQDKHLVEKLKRELPGILAWAVRGCLEWQTSGLGVPEEVRSATEAYRAEMDVIGAFIADRCILSAGARVKAGDLYEAYRKWCEENKEEPLNKIAFGLRLAERGLVSERDMHARYWRGIGLLTDT